MAGDLHSRSISSSGGRLLSLGSVTAKICNFAIFCQWLSFNVVQFQTSCDSLSVGYVIQGVNTCENLHRRSKKSQNPSKMGTGRRQCRCCWKFKLQVGVVVICSPELQRILMNFVCFMKLFVLKPRKFACHTQSEIV